MRQPLQSPLLIGTAGWSIPREEAPAFPTEGTHLQRYATRFTAVEINSSFYRPHRPATYARWAEGVPAEFRFSVKVPKAITHTARLRGTGALLDSFLEGPSALGEKLGCLLVQLPPSLAYDAADGEAFFSDLRARYAGDVACEPRHATWLAAEAEAMLTGYRVARVGADPDRPAGAGQPGGWPGVRYHRLHGSPRMYYSQYPEDYLEQLVGALLREREAGRTVWCIFDNTAAGAATRNALEILSRTGLSDF